MTALHLAPHGKVVLVTKRALADCNTNFAQGGICSVAAEGDTFAAHMKDTQIAGAGLCTERVVARIVAEAPKGIADLIKCGVKFAKKPRNIPRTEPVFSPFAPENLTGNYTKRKNRLVLY